MRATGSERRDEPADEPRVPLRRVVLWGLIGAAVLIGVFLYFQYERVLAPLISS